MGKKKRLASFALAVALTLSTIGVVPAVESKEVQATSGDTWYLVPDETFSDTGLSSDVEVNTKKTTFKVFTTDSSYTNLRVQGTISGGSSQDNGSLIINGIYTDGDVKTDTLNIPATMQICYTVDVDTGTQQVDGEGSDAVKEEKTEKLSYTVTLPNGQKGTAIIKNCYASSAKVELNWGTYNVKEIAGGAIVNGNQPLEYKNIVVPSTVTAIDASAFAGNELVESIDLSALTSYTTIQASTFKGCINLKEVKLNSKAVRVLANAFDGCAKLQSFDMSDLIEIGKAAFNGCQTISSIELSGSLQDIPQNAFNGTAITEIDLRNCKRIQSIGAGAFSGCVELEQVFLPDVNITINSSAFDLTSKTLRYIYTGSQDYSTTFKSYASKLVKETDLEATPVVVKTSATGLTGDNVVTSVTSGTTLVIASAVDIDPSSVTIMYNDVTDLTNSAEIGLTTGTYSVSGHSTKCVTFSIPVDKRGNYQVTATDVLGNKKVRTIAYTNTENDTTAPAIYVDGKQYTNGSKTRLIGYSANLVVKEENSLSTFTVNGVSKIGQENGYTLDGVNTYNIVATDYSGNKTSVTIILIGDDTEAPKLSGVAHNGVYNKAVTITYSDDSEVSISGGNKGVQKGNTITFTDEGKYNLTFTDAYKNKTTISFQIDITAPTFSGFTANSCTNKAVKVSAKDTNLASITVDGASFVSGGEVSAEGTHTVVATDVAGNKATATFTIDTTAPVLNGITDGMVSKKAVVINASDAISGVASITVGKNTVSNGYKLTNNTKAYTVTVKDNAGNSAKYTVTVDTKKPTISTSLKKLKKGGKLVVKDNYGLKSVKVGKKTYKCSGKKSYTVKLKKKGKQKVVITDVAGNKVTKTIKVK